MILIVQPIANTLIIMITNLPTSARETLLNLLTNRFRDLKYWEYHEARDLRLIAETYGFTELANEIKEAYGS